MSRGAAVFICCLALGQDQTFRVQTRVVQVPTVVTSREGRGIDGLRASDFTVLDNGARQEITVDDFNAGLPPISLVIAIQSSGISRLALAKIVHIAGMIEPLITGRRGAAAMHKIEVSVDRPGAVVRARTAYWVDEAK